jgi:hypothetical protein
MIELLIIVAMPVTLAWNMYVTYNNGELYEEVLLDEEEREHECFN